MSSLSHNSPATTADTAPVETPVPAAEIDASTRTPISLLTCSATSWLTLSALLGLLASLKFHAPALLAECPLFTYGRVQAAQTNVFLYGFAAQAALALLLWLIARLGRTTVVQPGIITAGGIFWNIGVTMGLIGILSGDNSGFEWLEFPRYAAPILLFAYLVIGALVGVTFHERRVRELYPSQWFLFASLFWFPWIFATACFLLLRAPGRGVYQSAINLWYGSNFSTIWLGFIGLAALFYFLPKLTNRPLASRYLAMFTFWTLGFFGAWGNIPSGSPFPAWMASLSTVMAVLAAIPVIAVAVNCYQTYQGYQCTGNSSPALKFVIFGVAAFVVAGLLNALSALGCVNETLNFTLFKPALSKLHLYGFFAMTAFGAIYYILPKVTAGEWPFPKFIKYHFWTSASGVVLFVAPLALGGYLQGVKLNDPSVAFNDSTKTALMFFRISTTGDFLMLIGSVFLFVNVKVLLYRQLKACCCACVCPEAAAKAKEVAA